jgi:hypothetical protein
MARQESSTNRVRASRARRVMSVYQNETGLSRQEVETATIDLIADLEHLCGQRQIEFESVLRQARTHYRAEIQELDNAILRYR